MRRAGPPLAAGMSQGNGRDVTLTTRGEGEGRAESAAPG